MLTSNKIQCVNIRTSPLKEFWGDEYDNDIYLWNDAKHNLTLKEIIDNETPTAKDLFASKEEINEGHEYCQKYYYKILPELVKRLNKYHHVDYSINFWKIAFGYWLYRHISCVYSKYLLLKNIELDKVDIKLLDINSFYIPTDHYDYLSCFANDYGVQQMVSQYFYLYQGNKKTIIKSSINDFRNEIRISEITPKYSLNNLVTWMKNTIKIFAKKVLSIQSEKEPNIALLGAYYPKNNFKNIRKNSDYKIGHIKIPSVIFAQKDDKIKDRKNIFKNKLDESFDSFFMHTLVYCMPNYFIENFRI